MPKPWSKKRLAAKKASKQTSDPDTSSPQVKRPRKELTTTNEAFETFYSQVLGFSDVEYDQFLHYLRQPLPSSFRIAGPENIKQMVNSQLQHFSSILSNVKASDICPSAPTDLSCAPLPISWYPGDRAFTLPIDRRAIRSSTDSNLKEFHSFLTLFSEAGFLVRQEAVSMIPPLFMKIQPGGKYLDLCAAPGSKSAQLIDFLAAEGNSELDLGVVISNDASQKRAYMMQHNLTKLSHGAPASLISNNDGREFPFPIFDVENDPQSNRFDSILADVPCSGTGTLRKNPLIWSSWTTHSELSLHPLQLAIALRAAQLVKIGGRLVYSTCSFSPIENEAVVASLLEQTGGSLQLVDVSNDCRGLQYSRGLNNWKVFDSKTNTWFESYDDVSNQNGFDFIKSTMFPVNNDLNLERCLRIYPQHQNSGGFFIAVFEKVKEIPGEAAIYDRALKTAKNKVQKVVYKSNQFAPLTFEEVDVSEVQNCVDDYELNENHLPFGLYRSNCLVKYTNKDQLNQPKSLRRVNLLTPSAKSLALNNFSSLRLVGGGLEVMNRFRKGRRETEAALFRLPHSSLPAIHANVEKRKVVVDDHTLIKGLIEHEEVEIGSFADENLVKFFNDLDSGSAVVLVKLSQGFLTLSVLVSKTAVKLLVPKLEVACYKVIWGILTATESRNRIMCRDKVENEDI
ncbi:hypothetical protein P9112_009786 [Eukaryota sp. TZLM1-RC]